METITIDKNTTIKEIEKKIKEKINFQQGTIFGCCIFTYNKEQTDLNTIILVSNDLCEIKDVFVDNCITESIEQIIDTIKQIQNAIKDDKKININIKKR